MLADVEDGAEDGRREGWKEEGRLEGGGVVVTGCVCVSEWVGTGERSGDGSEDGGVGCLIERLGMGPSRELESAR